LDKFSPSDLWTALLVFLAVCAAVVTIGEAVKTVKGWSNSPKVDAEIRRINARLDDHEHAIERAAEDIADQKNAQKATLVALQALLDHALHNGNADQLQRASDGITNYLIEKR